MADVSRLSGTRAPLASDDVVAVLPRGDVRREDLATFRVEIGEDFRGRGSVRFLRGTEEFHAAPFVPRRLDTEAALPASVLDALRPGDRITWGVSPERGEPRTAQFTVSAATSADALAALDARLDEQPPAVRRHLRAQRLLADGLPLAAYREAEAVVAERPGNELGWAVMLEALRRLGLEDSRLHHGADAQVKLCEKEYPKKRGITTYFITGNHDRSFWKTSGNEIGSKIMSLRPDLVHLGYQEADIVVGDDDCKATIRLFHPEDGSMSYAISYKPQRYIAELPSGTKPDLLLIGHYHKAEMLFYGGVTTIQGGTIQKQTPFMRGKRISAAVGFWLLELTVGKQRVISVKAKFYPIRS